MMLFKNPEKGFSLLEMLLVLAIASSLLLMLVGYTSQRGEQVRIDKAALQMQQVLNAAAAFYVNNSRWPGSSGGAVYTGGIDELKTAGYLPNVTANNPWGRLIWTASPSTNVGVQSPNAPRFYVTSITGINSVNLPKSQANATIVSGKLPFGFITDWTHWNQANASPFPAPSPQTSGCAAGDGCSFAVGSIAVPGQNLNNARSVNYAGIYHSGACVPAPNCPAGTTPSILVAAVQVNGIYDNVTCSGNPLVCSGNYYPITSFSAYARGANSTGVPADYSPGPQNCEVSAATTNHTCNQNNPAIVGDPAGTKYWRVCLVVVTNKGQAYPFDVSRTGWQEGYPYEHGKMLGSVLAVTRCVPNNGNEVPTGSDFNVWVPNGWWKP